MPSPNPSSTQSAFNSVSCLWASNCVAVGYWDDPSTVELPLAEEWDGTAWSVVAPPLPNGATQGTLNSVSCVSATFCMSGGSQSGLDPYAVGRLDRDLEWHVVAERDGAGSDWLDGCWLRLSVVHRARLVYRCGRLGHSVQLSKWWLERDMGRHLVAGR